MSIIGSSMMAAGSVPFLSGLQLYLDSSDSSTITKTYQNLAATGSGTSGTTTITAASTEANLVQAGMKLRIGGTDIYTVASVSTVTITTVETLTNNYVAQAMALDRISQWNDKSGKGNNISQGTALSQAIYTPNKLNSLASVTFDGIALYAVPAALITALVNSNNTVFMVGNSTAPGTPQQRFIGITDGSLARFNLELTSSVGTAGYACATGAAGQVTIGSITTTNFNIYSAFRSGTTQSIQINNGTAQTNSSGADITWTTGNIGQSATGTVPVIGNINIILIYNRALSTTEIIQVNRWLSNRTAITIS